jgi:predicted regulator of Ras-like GTPase activity (Roadblock/LC7/MglB family)
VFDEILEAVRERAAGVRSVLLLGADGVVVAGTGDDRGGWDPLAASYADLARRTETANRDVDLPRPREWVVGCDTATLVLRAVTDEYLLLAVLAPGGSLGRTRYELRKAAAAALPELQD